MRYNLHYVDIIDSEGQGKANSTWSEEMEISGEDCWDHAMNAWANILTGKFFVLESGFCVSKGITAFLEFDVYDYVLTKKRKYWPKGVLQYAIDQ